MTLYLIEKTLPGLDVDVAWWWEDMCYNRGPLISPKLFKELMVPRYRRITDTLRKHGIDINILDCDGNIHELVPGWLEGGINVMFPIESAHTDVMKLREEFGKDVLLIGAVDKRALIKGREAIDQELARLQPLVEKGGYIPTVDHRVPADVTFDHYLYYVEKKREMLG
jgi:uroporphyrinogen-III decarboxylase